MMQNNFKFSPPAQPGPFQRAIAHIHADPLAFNKVTEFWLNKNRSLWLNFYNAAERMRQSGRRHYGARAIIEYIRFQTLVVDSSATFKINNNYISGLARLYNRVTGTRFFETRES